MTSFKILPICIFLVLSGCAKTSSSTDTSVSDDVSSSGMVVSALGGALSSSNSTGSIVSNLKLQKKASPHFDFFPSAFASTSCPTFATAGSGCAVSGASMWLTYSSCSFGSSTATWSGTQLLKMSTGSATCGSFPSPGASQNLIRQFVSAVRPLPQPQLERAQADLFSLLTMRLRIWVTLIAKPSLQ